ncbi:MAG: hypothetical protein CSYNP_03652 [Syntrophus sp. SKADARSKE-3]|nr:hypothetical protein [Syntrophus sp. SKADARSKE-3]
MSRMMDNPCPFNTEQAATSLFFNLLQHSGFSMISCFFRPPLATPLCGTSATNICDRADLEQTAQTKAQTKSGRMFHKRTDSKYDFRLGTDGTHKNRNTRARARTHARYFHISSSDCLISFYRKMYVPLCLVNNHAAFCLFPAVCSCMFLCS